MIKIQMDTVDIEKLLTLMPNKRYSRLIELNYVKSFTHEETAQALGMTMANYYNKHKLAKEQFIKIYTKLSQVMAHLHNLT